MNELDVTERTVVFGEVDTAKQSWLVSACDRRYCTTFLVLPPDESVV